MQLQLTAVPDGAALIQLGGRYGSPIRGYAVVDEADYDELNQYSWYLARNGYPVRGQWVGNGRTLQIYMHRHLLGLERGDGTEVDHINQNKLDNRRANLRVVTHAANMQNVASRRGASSSFRGVYWDKSRGKWGARAHIDGHAHYLGRFATEEAAHEACSEFRRAHMPYARAD